MGFWGMMEGVSRDLHLQLQGRYGKWIGRLEQVINREISLRKKGELKFVLGNSLPWCIILVSIFEGVDIFSGEKGLPMQSDAATRTISSLTLSCNYIFMTL